MILSDRTILSKLQSKEIIIKPTPTSEQIQPSSIDLRLGNEYLSPIHSQETIDIKNNEPKYQQMKGDAIILPANEFILATTKEYVEIPTNLIARVEGRSSVGRLGIAIHITAGFIDAGFKGQITLEIKNLSHNNIILYEDMRICQLVFEELNEPAMRPYGECNNKYQNQKGVTGSLMYWDNDLKPVTDEDTILIRNDNNDRR